jgi:hypothetical protein
MLDFQGFARTNDGRLIVIGLAAGTAPPAGTEVFNGLARSHDGYLYVVFS